VSKGNPAVRIITVEVVDINIEMYTYTYCHIFMVVTTADESNTI
jgi:hypothetical protein